MVNLHMFEIALTSIYAWQLAIAKSSIFSLFLPQGCLNCADILLLYVQQFLRYRSIFEIPIFGHESSGLRNVPEIVCMYLPSSTPLGQNWTYFRSMGSTFLDCLTYHIWAWNLEVWKPYICILFWAYLATWNVAYKIPNDFKNCMAPGMMFRIWKKKSSRNTLYFRYTQWDWSLLVVYRQQFLRYRSIFKYARS